LESIYKEESSSDLSDAEAPAEDDGMDAFEREMMKVMSGLEEEGGVTKDDLKNLMSEFQ